MKSKLLLTVSVVLMIVVASCGPTSFDDTPTQEAKLPSTNTSSTPLSTPTNDTSTTSTEEVCTVAHGTPLFSTPGGAESVTVDQDGNLYTSDFCSGEVFRIQPDGTNSVLATLPFVDENCKSNSIGITISKDGNLLVVVLSKKPEYNGVWMVKQDGTMNIEFPMPPENAPFPNDLVIDSIGNLYITESITGTIWKAPPGGTPKPWVQSELLSPISLGDLGANGIAIFENNLYSSNTTRNTIIKIPIESDGEAGEPVVFATEVYTPDGMIFNDQGQLYIVSFDLSQLIQISPDGKPVSKLRLSPLGVSFPTDIAFAPGEKNNIAYIALLHSSGDDANLVKLLLCPPDK